MGVTQNLITRDLGPVTSYAIAVEAGYQGTQEEWAQLIANTTANALKTEGYAVGEQNGTEVQEGSPYYENNAKYYSEYAGDCAERAEYCAANAGYMRFYINSSGELIYEHTLNVGLTFELQDGELIMVCPAQ